MFICMSSHISHKNLTPINISGQFWILVQTYMYFTVTSAMPTQATGGCKSLAKYFGSAVHWTIEVPPTSGFDQSCFADWSRFITGPILVWIPVHGFLLLLLLQMKIYAHLNQKTKKCGLFNFNFLFSQKLLYCWHGIFWDNLLHLQIWFQIFFNWWHSPFAWWHS